MSDEQSITTTPEITQDKPIEPVAEEKKEEMEIEEAKKEDKEIEEEKKEEMEIEEEKKEEKETEEEKKEETEAETTVPQSDPPHNEEDDNEEDENEDSSESSDYTDSDSDSDDFYEEEEEEEPLPPGLLNEDEWVEHIVGMPEGTLREDDNITKAISKIEKIEKYNTHRFDFTNETTGKTYSAGYFYLESVRSLQSEFNERPGNSEVFKSCKFIADVRQDYAQEKNDGCMFQAASNFNGVEAIGEYSRPDGRTFITDYTCDNTQGPAASISAGAGAISRVLLPFYDPSTAPSEWRQTKAKQMEMLSDVSDYFSVINGYVVQNGSEKAVAEDIEDAENREIVNNVKVCVHVDEDVVYGERDNYLPAFKLAEYCGPQKNTSETSEPESAPTSEKVDEIEKKKENEQTSKKLNKICQVFCAAMNLGQGSSGEKNLELEGNGVKAKLLLEAAYKGTYLAAIRHNCPKIFLTLIGGGVFGNSIAGILDVIEKVHLEIACNEKNDVIKEVHVVLFNLPPTLSKFLTSLREKGVEVEIHGFKDNCEIVYKEF